MRACALIPLLLCGSVGATPTANTICVYNDAAFVLHYHLYNADTKSSSPESSSYPVWQTKCQTIGGAAAGASIQPVVRAVLGKELSADAVLYDAVNATQITYVCTGTTLDYSCKQGPPPATAANVTKAVGEFILGFVEGIGKEVGFADCIADLDTLFSDIAAAVDFFEQGFSSVTISTIVKAFELIAAILKDFAAAITVCAADAVQFANDVKSIAAALAGDVAAVLKIVVEEGIHIWKDRQELTTDAKAVTADWNAGDYKGSGAAVGDMVGILIAGL